MRDFSKSKFCHVIHYERPPIERPPISWLRTNRSLRNGSISLNFLVCNHFVAISLCCWVIITEFALQKKKKLQQQQQKKNNRTEAGIQWWVIFFFKRLHTNDSFSLKCMACNHFVAFYLLPYHNDRIQEPMGSRRICAL